MSVRGTMRGAWRASGSGILAGAFVLVCLFGLDFVGATLDFMGFSDSQATQRIVHRYGPQIARDQLIILATYLLAGGLFGAIGALAGALWRDDRAAARRGTAARWLEGGVAALLCHGYLFVRSLVRYPQLYSESLYDHGGLRRSFMVGCTQHFTTARLDVMMATLLLAALGAPLLRRPWSRSLASGAWRRRLGGALIAVMLLVGSLLVGARRGRAHAAPPSGRPNIVLIAVDSLRADRLFGPGRERFAAMSRLAARGVRFRAAHVTVPRTFPSFVTLLTGRYPHHHGIRHMFPSAVERAAIGPALPGALKAAGYRTVVVSDYAGEIFSRTPLGFSSVEAPYFDMKTIVAERGLQVHPNMLPYATGSIGRRLFPAVNALPEISDPERLADQAIARLDDGSPSPLFLTVFFSTAHFPYAAPAPYYQRYALPDYDGPYRYQKPPLSPPPSDERGRAQIRGLYDGAVAATDAAIGRILDRLDASGQAENTIVVLLADHGENLYDPPERGMGHGDHLQGSHADHVPLVIADLRRGGGIVPHDVDAIVRDVDVAPTLAALVAIPGPPSDGTSLVPLLRGERRTLDLYAFHETELWFIANGPGFPPEERLPYPTVTGTTDLAPDDDVYLRPQWRDLVVVAKHRAVESERWKLRYVPTRAGVRWSLYDLAHDPDERHDVGADYPDVAALLKETLQRWMLEDRRMTLRADFLVPR